MAEEKKTKEANVYIPTEKNEFAIAIKVIDNYLSEEKNEHKGI